MSDKYAAWLTALANRDNTLVTLSLIAFSLVLAWALVPLVWKKLQQWVYRAFMIGGMALFIYLLIRSFLGTI